MDTGAFLAIENRRDAHHVEAVAERDRLLATGELLVTTDYVLDETFTLLSVRASRSLAVEFGEAVRASRFLHVEYLTPDLLEAAWQIFKTFADKEFSFTDCTSFAFMERHGIVAAFSFDRHFRQYGRLLVYP